MSFSKVLTVIVLSSTLLSGCSSNISKEDNKAGYDYFLIPALGLGTSGTFSPISNHYSITTKNIASRTNSKVVFDSTDDCGLNLVKKNNKNKFIPILGKPHINEKVYSYGYNEYTGKIEKTTGFIINKALDGKKTCPLMLTTLSRNSDFSGGPVYNEKSELVGIMEYTEDDYGSDYKTGKKYSIIIPLTSLAPWLREGAEGNDYGNEIIDNDYKNNNVLNTSY